MAIMNTHRNTPPYNKTSKKTKPLRFIVLVPHRDCRGILEDYRQRLFSKGFSGAYSFPPVAPLAIVSSSYKKEELIVISHALRQTTLLKDGKITASGTAQTFCPHIFPHGEGFTFFGPLLDLPPLETIPGLINSENNGKVLYTFPKVVLCTALLKSWETQKPKPQYNEGEGEGEKKVEEIEGIEDIEKEEMIIEEKIEDIEYKSFSFRPAMVTNLALLPLEQGTAPYSNQWRLYEGSWLPAYKRPKD